MDMFCAFTFRQVTLAPIEIEFVQLGLNDKKGDTTPSTTPKKSLCGLPTRSFSGQIDGKPVFRPVGAF